MPGPVAESMCFLVSLDHSEALANYFSSNRLETKCANGGAALPRGRHCTEQLSQPGYFSLKPNPSTMAAEYRSPASCSELFFPGVQSIST